MMGKKITFSQMMESFRILQAICRSNETCAGCWLYDPEEKETACLICKAEGNLLADNITTARNTICLSNINLAPRKIVETNGDRIRGMTDKELADFLMSEDAQACEHCEFNNGINCTLDNPCVKELAWTEFMDWLSSKVEPSSESDPAEGEDKEN